MSQANQKPFPSPQLTTSIKSPTNHLQMLMVALLADSGFFDWAAVKMYELSKGRIWVMITLLNVGTAVMSAFLVRYYSSLCSISSKDYVISLTYIVIIVDHKSLRKAWTVFVEQFLKF